MPDAIDVLVADHDKVRALFGEFRDAKDADDHHEMQALQAKIFDELETHTQIEEDVFYPAVRNLDVAELTESVDESIQEHHVVKVLMREIADLSEPDIFAAKMTVLIENVEHHADEEESDMFPPVRENMSADDLDRLGDELTSARSPA